MSKKITLSDYVREMASRKSLSGKDIEKKSRKEITFTYVNDIINGKSTNPTVKKLQALALGLGVSEDELFRVARGLPIEEVANPVEAELIEKFHRLSEERQQEVLKLLDFYDSMDSDTRMGQEWAREEALPDVIEAKVDLNTYSPDEGD